MSKAFAERMRSRGNSLGQYTVNKSNLLMDHTFTRDPNYRVANLYDRDMNLLEDNVDIKFQSNVKVTLAKDQVEYNVQFRPGFHPEKEYTCEDGKERLGFYIDIPNNLGDMERWIILSKNDRNFTRYVVLKCNWTFKFVAGGKIYSILGVLRSANNYNSGVWSD